MLTSRDVYIHVNPLNTWELNEAHKNGYHIVDIIYKDIVEKQVCVEKEPIPFYGSSSGSYGGYNNYGNNNPSYRTVEKEQYVVRREPTALMKLGGVAEVIYGKDT